MALCAYWKGKYTKLSDCFFKASFIVKNKMILIQKGMDSMTHKNKNTDAKQNTSTMVNELERTITADELTNSENTVIGDEKGASEKKEDDCGTCRSGL